MSNIISSAIFACRNVDKTQNGEVGRAPVAAVQTINVMNQAAKYNKAIAKGAELTTSVFNKWADKNRVVNYTVKGINWATKNVNPLICVSGGVKVLMSDDKVSSGIKEAAALSTMFAGEAVAKKVLPEIIKKIPVGNKVGTLINGLLFVGASIGSYSVGEVLGKDLAKEVKANWSGKSSKINQKA